MYKGYNAMQGRKEKEKVTYVRIERESRVKVVASVTHVLLLFEFKVFLKTLQRKLF